VLFDASSFLSSSTSSIAGLAGAVGTAEDSGSSPLESDRSAGQVGGFLLASPALPSGFATLGDTIGSDQSMLSTSALAAGDLSPVNGGMPNAGAIASSFVITFNAVPPVGSPGIETIAIANPLLIAFKAGALATLASWATPTFLTSRPVHPVLPSTETLDGFASIDANGGNTLGGAPNAGNAPTVVGISGKSLAPPETSRVGAFACNPLTISGIRELAGGRLTEIRHDSDGPALWSPCTMPAAEPHPQHSEPGASLSGLVVPSPQRSGPITVFRPFDEAAVGPMIDRLLEQFEDLGAGLSWHWGPTDVVVELVAVAVVLSAWVVVPKILGRSPDEGLAPVDVATSLDGISGLAASSNREEP
jgi:hypothetical protein